MEFSFRFIYKYESFTQTHTNMCINYPLMKKLWKQLLSIKMQFLKLRLKLIAQWEVKKI